jgi:hypothetical protein
VTLTAPAPTSSGLTTPVVLGLDPSLTGTGLASSNGWCELIGYEKARSKDPGITTLPHPTRLDAMRGILNRITEHIGSPALVVMETPLSPAAAAEPTNAPGSGGSSTPTSPTTTSPSA